MFGPPMRRLVATSAGAPAPGLWASRAPAGQASRTWKWYWWPEAGRILGEATTGRRWLVHIPRPPLAPGKTKIAPRAGRSPKARMTYQ